MSALLLTLLRFGFLALLWIFVLIVVATVRHDVFGTHVRPRQKRPVKSRRKARKAASDTAAASSPAQPQPLFLVVTQGPLAGTRLELAGGQIIIGRSPDSSLVLDDGYASSRHARIYRSGDRVVIEDLNSTNGTWIKGVQIHEPTVLNTGVPVVIGKTTLEVRK